MQPSEPLGNGLAQRHSALKAADLHLPPVRAHQCVQLTYNAVHPISAKVERFERPMTRKDSERPCVSDVPLSLARGRQGWLTGVCMYWRHVIDVAFLSGGGVWSSRVSRARCSRMAALSACRRLNSWRALSRRWWSESVEARCAAGIVRAAGCGSGER